MTVFTSAHAWRVSTRSLFVLVAPLLVFTMQASGAQPNNTHTVRLIAQAGYLPQIPVLVRVELLDATGRPDRSVWDADALLSETATGVTLSTNRIILRNGLGTALVTITGTGDFDLTATVGPVQATRNLRDLSSQPVTTVGGTLAGTVTTWSGVVNVTNDVTVPTGHTLTIESNTLVLVNGVASGTTAPDILISGSIQSLGTEAHPVAITCASAALRWGQIRHNSAQPSLYRFTSITRAGRAPGEGHTGTGPAIRPSNSRIVFENCTISDHAERSGLPGKIMQASGSDLVFDSCVLSRARMGPEIGGTALLVTNSYFVEMNGPDDADGIYIHSQGAGQSARLIDSVVAVGDDDGIDTLGSVVEVVNCVIRDWASRVEDAKGISVFNGATHVRGCLIVDCTVGITAKWSGGSPTLVTVYSSTLTDNLTNLWANLKGNAPGPFIDFRVTNSVLWGGDPIQSDFGITNFTLGYNVLGEAWPGTNNVVQDPLFVDAADHDYRLLIGSPAIDGGDPTSPIDPDGSRIDLGAFAFEVPTPALAAPRRVAGAFEFELSAYTNRNYRVEYSTNAQTWATLETITHSDDPRTISDPSPDRTRIYRVRLVP
jgi:hypothetical protein